MAHRTLNDVISSQANHNRIPLLDGKIEAQLRPKRQLNTLYLEGNPLQAAAGPTYRLKVHMMVPQLQQIDAALVKTSA
ncbi:hypothetical protein HDU76_014132 [Blyttiomyces sp. JEL0837]|nr:hypothetical protein HDU76_014132 [Blyttiomyces sp. JEL0837]